MKLAALALLACLGDSNTARLESWCERLEPQIQTVNLAVRRTTAAPSRHSPYGAEQLALTQDNPSVDTVIFAFGTNDVSMLMFESADLFVSPSPVAIVDEMETLIRDAEAAGLNAFVATVPPRFDLPDTFAQTHIDSINLLLRKRGLPIVDFDRGFKRADFEPDGIHLTSAGQDRRAKRVLQALPEPSLPLAVLIGIGVLRSLAHRVPRESL